MTRPRVFVTQPIAGSALARLREVADVEVNGDASRIPEKEALIAAARRCDILLSLLHDTIDADVLAANPQLRGLATMTITPDRIDVAEATRRGIPVTNIPAVVTEATADLAFGLLLAVARRIVEGDKAFRQGVYPGSQSNHFIGAAVAGKTLGIVGCGRIGQAVARRAGGFGMRVLYADPKRLAEEEERKLGAAHMPLDDLLREADFVSLHSRLAPDTRHLIDDDAFAKMKPGAFIINTSRGSVINEAALLRALQRKKIAGAGLDVYEYEPAVSPVLLAMPNVVLTPHVGSAVFELREAMAHIVVDNVIAVIEGRRPPNCINPEVLGK